MQDEIKAVVEVSASGSDAGALTFPEVIQNLAYVGIERYHTDLQRAEKIFYLPDGQSHLVSTKALAVKVASRFDAAGVEAAVRTIQRGEIGYLEFCERIMRAGCASYIVSISGRRAVYYGRAGETFVEPFPQAA